MVTLRLKLFATRGAAGFIIANNSLSIITKTLTMKRLTIVIPLIVMVGIIAHSQAKDLLATGGKVPTLYGYTEEETGDGLVFYYPQFETIDLECQKMPDPSDKSVVFCCEAAFTGKLLDRFDHSNIADRHFSHGVEYKGYKCNDNDGAFVLDNSGVWQIIPKDKYKKVKQANTAFCQRLIIHDGAPKAVWKKIKDKRTVYRSLCVKDGRLCIAQSADVVSYETFVALLQKNKVQQALYLDMGSGWNYAWFRSTVKGKVEELFPESKQADNYKYRTNWIVFRKNVK